MNMNISFTSTILVLFLQTFTYLTGQMTRMFNPRGNPNRFTQRLFLNQRIRERPEIPSFLNDHLAWAYANHEKFISNRAQRRQSFTSRHKQYNQKGKVFGYCDIGNDEDLDGLFPGMFQSESEILSETTNVVKKERWYGNTIRTYGPPKSKVPQTVESTTQRLALSNNLTEITVTGPPLSLDGAPVCHCCKTNSRHEVYRNITIDDRTYNVIQLPGKFQAIPVGRCPQSNLCLYGDCVQHYSVHHVLIWNDTVPYWPPFDFALIEYPTHCSWENIGI